MPGDHADVLEPGTGSSDEHEAHRHEVLPDDLQARDGRERILRDRHAAVDRVLDRSLSKNEKGRTSSFGCDGPSPFGSTERIDRRRGAERDRAEASARGGSCE